MWYIFSKSQFWTRYPGTGTHNTTWLWRILSRWPEAVELCSQCLSNQTSVHIGRKKIDLLLKNINHMIFSIWPWPLTYYFDLRWSNGLNTRANIDKLIDRLLRPCALSPFIAMWKYTMQFDLIPYNDNYQLCCCGIHFSSITKLFAIIAMRVKEFVLGEKMIRQSEFTKVL